MYVLNIIINIIFIMNNLLIQQILQGLLPNKNGRIYTKELYDKYIKEMEYRIKQEERYKKINKLKNKINENK